MLVDARTAQVTAAPALPWYLVMLLVSQPLHFGDYAGMPMQILWALLDVATIIVLVSGLVLWFRRRQLGGRRRIGSRGRGHCPGRHRSRVDGPRLASSPAAGT